MGEASKGRAHIPIRCHCSSWRTYVEQWDKKLALFFSLAVHFIRCTQRPVYDQMVKLHGAELDAKLVEALVKERDTKGTLHVLRHRFKF